MGQENLTRDAAELSIWKEELSDLARTLDQHIAEGMRRLRAPEGEAEEAESWEALVELMGEDLEGLAEAESLIYDAVDYVGAKGDKEDLVEAPNRTGHEMLRTAMHERFTQMGQKRACLYSAGKRLGPPGGEGEEGEEGSYDVDVQARLNIIETIFQSVGKDVYGDDGELAHAGRTLSFEEFNALMSMRSLADLTHDIGTQIMSRAVSGLSDWERVKQDLVFTEFRQLNNATVEMVSGLVVGVCEGSQAFMNREIESQDQAAKVAQTELRADFDVAIETIGHPLNQSNNYSEYNEQGKRFTANLAAIIQEARDKKNEAQKVADGKLSQEKANVIETIDTNFDLVYHRRGAEEPSVYLDVGLEGSESLQQLKQAIEDDYSFSDDGPFEDEDPNEEA